MGAWNFIDPYLEWVLVQVNYGQTRPRYIGRPRRRRDGDRAHVQASGADEGLHRRGVRLTATF